ncbi:hypothetical protein NE237_009341 [Protea cynaroides]|uniref:DUF4283 domain-containing protein n=1 Tax=Protea cynaroides TaxID=273540 RepID=A0A9Q0KYF1_9MAGN|nr:hypothetical protein NE237_009341 [Protea cynaroides]
MDPKGKSVILQPDSGQHTESQEEISEQIAPPTSTQNSNLIKKIETVLLEDDAEDQCSEFGQLTLIGKVITGKSYCKQAVFEALPMAWNLCHQVLVSIFSTDIYTFKFSHILDLQNVMREAPWSVSGNLIALEHWNDLHTCNFDKVDFWIQLHNIPPEFFNENMTSKLTSLFGNVSQLMIIDGINQGQKIQFIRARTTIDICKPLRCNQCFEFDYSHKKEHGCNSSDGCQILSERHYVDMKAIVPSLRLLEKAKIIKRESTHSPSSQSSNQSSFTGSSSGKILRQTSSSVTFQIPEEMPARHPPTTKQVSIIPTLGNSKDQPDNQSSIQLSRQKEPLHQPIHHEQVSFQSNLNENQNQTFHILEQLLHNPEFTAALMQLMPRFSGVS